VAVEILEPFTETVTPIKGSALSLVTFPVICRNCAEAMPNRERKKKTKKNFLFIMEAIYLQINNVIGKLIGYSGQQVYRVSVSKIQQESNFFMQSFPITFAAQTWLPDLSHFPEIHTFKRRGQLGSVMSHKR
jgi:hypothetical protein